MDKQPDYLSMIRVVSRAVITALVFPTVSRTPSGIYKVEPDGLGGNRFTLLEPMEVDGRRAKAWSMVQSQLANHIASCRANKESALCRELENGTPWENLEPLLS